LDRGTAEPAVPQKIQEKQVIPMKKKTKSILTLSLLVVVVYAVFFILQPKQFGSLESLYILIQQILLPSVAACGFYFVLTMGLFDFTLGSNIILSSLVGVILSTKIGYAGLVIGCVLVGAVIGFANGLMYNWFKIPSIIVTVGLLIVYEAIGCLISPEGTLRLSDDFRILRSFPWNFLVALAAFVFATVLIKSTKTGIYINAIGRNEQMAKNMGVNVNRYKVIGFALCGLFAGICALLTISYGSSIQPVSGLDSMSRNFTPLMGCFFGVAFKKYINPVVAIFIGEFVISLITTGIMTNGVDSTLQNALVGVIMIIIVAIMSRENLGEVVK
jgi:ribose transport system permease protein